VERNYSAGQTYDHPVISLDIFSTAVAISEVSPKIIGWRKSSVPFLTGENKGISASGIVLEKLCSQQGLLSERQIVKQILETDKIFLFDNSEGYIGKS